MDESEFQESDFLNLIRGLFHGRLRQTGQLNENAIGAFRFDEWFGDAKGVDAFAEHLDGLRQRRAGGHGGIGIETVRVQSDEERHAALEIEAEFDPAGSFALQGIENKSRWIGSLLGFDEWEIVRDVIAADRYLQVGVAEVRPF